MQYSANLTFTGAVSETSKTHLNQNIPVSKMAVDGGTKRMIDFSSTTDVSLVSELEQALSFKNIILYLSSTADGSDRKAAVDLISLAAGKISLSVALIIEKKSEGKLLEGFTLIEDIATQMYPPVNAFENTFMVTLKLSETRLYQGVWKAGNSNLVTL